MTTVLNPPTILVSVLLIVEIVVYLVSGSSRRYQRDWADREGQGGWFYRIVMLVLAIAIVAIAVVSTS